MKRYLQIIVLIVFSFQFLKAQQLFFDDFSTDLSKWTTFTDGGNWWVQGGKLYANYDISSGSVYDSQSDIILKDAYQPTGNWKASVKFKLTTDPNYPNYTPTSAQFAIYLDSNRKIYFAIGWGGDNLPQNLTKISASSGFWNGTWTVQKTEEFNYTWNTAIENVATLEKIGTTYKMYINGTYLTEFVDTYYSGAGKLGLHTYGPKIYDDFTITQGGKNLLYLKEGTVSDWTTQGASGSQFKEIKEWEKDGYTVTTQKLSTTVITSTLLSNYQVLRLNTCQGLDRSFSNSESQAIYNWVNSGGKLLADIVCDVNATAVTSFGISSVTRGPNYGYWTYGGAPLKTTSLSGPYATTGSLAYECMNVATLTNSTSLTVAATYNNIPTVTFGQFGSGKVVITFASGWSHDATWPGNAYRADINQESNLAFLKNTIEYFKQSSVTTTDLILVYNQIDAASFPIIKSYVTLSDKNGNSISNLSSSNFTVSEDGAQQSPISVNQVGSGSNIAVALVIDRSGSMSGKPLTDAKSAASIFINKMQNGDKGSIIHFGSDVTVGQAFTTDKTMLQNAINNILSNGSTALFDATYQAIELTKVQNGRKAIILLSDGANNASSKNKIDVIAYANQFSIPLYTIGLAIVTGSQAETDLKDLANNTGGLYYNSLSSSDLQNIYSAISQQLSNQYLITYTTTNAKTDGSTRSVLIKATYNGLSDTKSKTYSAPLSGNTLVSIKPNCVNPQFPGEFYVDIVVGDPNTISDLYGISFKLKSNSPSVTYVDNSAASGDFLGSNVIAYFKKIDEQNVDMAVSKSSTPGLSGKGVVAKAKFKTPSSLSTDLNVTFSLYDITAVNSNGDAIILDPSAFQLTIKAITTITVWPGDCNNDKTVTSSDIIPIGLFYGQTKSSTNVTGSSWQAFSREPWSADGATPKRIYADANGDGTINSADIIPIGLNYSKVHASVRENDFAESEKLNKSTADATIVPIGPNKTKNNVKFTITIKVGDPIQISNLYGISFKLKSNNSSCSYVDGTAKESNFLGTSVLTFFKKVDEQTVDIAVTKNNTPGNSGSGIIATADFISTIDQAVSFSLSDVMAIDDKGNSISLNVQSSIVTVGIDNNIKVPTEYVLSQNYPNPFNPITTIKYELPLDGMVSLKVFDAIGNEVASLVNGEKAAGRYEIKFDGSSLTSGVYFYRIKSGVFSEAKKLMLMK